MLVTESFIDLLAAQAQALVSLILHHACERLFKAAVPSHIDKDVSTLSIYN